MANSSARACPHRVSPALHSATSPSPHLASRGMILAVFSLGNVRHLVWVYRRAQQLSANTAHVHPDAREVVPSAIAQSQVVTSKVPKAPHKRSRWALANESNLGSCTSMKDPGIPARERKSHFLRQICRIWKVVVE